MLLVETWAEAQKPAQEWVRGARRGGTQVPAGPLVGKQGLLFTWCPYEMAHTVLPLGNAFWTRQWPFREPEGRCL